MPKSTSLPSWRTRMKTIRRWGWNWCGIYRSMGRVVEAMSYAEEYLAETQNVEEKRKGISRSARQWNMSMISNRQSGSTWLRLELEPRHKFQRYFIRNNIGFSLNQLDRYLEAEKYLCEAIAIDTTTQMPIKILNVLGRAGEICRSSQELHFRSPGECFG